MQNLAYDLESAKTTDSHSEIRTLEVVSNQAHYRDRDSLSENFNNELDAWARHALARSGFGGY